MCKPKEAGYVLAMDQASNAAGASLWYNGDLVACTTLLSDKKSDAISIRLQSMVVQLDVFLRAHLHADDRIRKVVFEGVQSKLVLITIGAFLTCPMIQAKVSPQKDFVYPSQWKSWARARGALGPIDDIKGVRALRETGFDVDKHRVLSDDAGDSILLYLTWRDQ